MRPNLRKQTSAALRRRRRQLLRQLPPLDRVLRGSLIERYRMMMSVIESFRKSAQCSVT
jgi:hypothetical protein